MTLHGVKIAERVGGMEAERGVGRRLDGEATAAAGGDRSREIAHGQVGALGGSQAGPTCF
jgi:hypothetical protein